MNNQKSTKSALITSVIALLLCFAMLFGTTFAWFTDEVVNSNNIIKTGTLEAGFYYADSNTDGTIKGNWITLDSDDDDYVDGTKVFNYNNWEPGYVDVKYVKIANEGSLAFKYKLNIIAEKVAKEDLASQIEVYFATTDGSQPIKRDALVPTNTALYVGDLDKLIADADGAAYGIILPTEANGASDDVKLLEKDEKLAVPGEVIACLALKMKETAGNEYQDLKIGDDKEAIKLQLLATQYTYENDSFDNLYDEKSEYPVPPADEWDGTADTAWYNDTDTEFVLNTSEQLAGLAELVDDGNNFAGKTITLDSDLDLAELSFNPIGHSSNGKSFNGTFDGQGHTISNLYQQSDLGAWQYEGEYYGLFAYTNGATIKNVTVADAYISSGRNEAAAIVGNAVDTTFSDITVSNTTLIAYNNSAGGVAAECYGNCSFTNITVDEDTVIGPLWGTYDVRLGGIVGLVHTGNNVTFKDINVACKLDAINDVAANYQYWLYRYCGMLIGHVDGVDGVADPTGYVTCENVTVTYGDWVNYHYCEDADLGAGSYNGPGEYKYARVEAGTGTGGIDLSTCNHNADESHNVLIVFDQLFGGGQGVKGLKTYDGVTVNYPN